MTADVALVSCVKTKADHRLPAKHLYISPWFGMARAYAEEHADQWFILSAQHGLLDPDEVIDPYEKTLTKMSSSNRVLWASKVVNGMDQIRLQGGTVLVLAGQLYRGHLIGNLMQRFEKIDIPMVGLPMGEQPRWLSKRTRRN